MATEETAGGRRAFALAKINLWNFPAGTYQIVDLDSGYVDMCIRSGHIVVVELLDSAPVEALPVDEGQTDA